MTPFLKFCLQHPELLHPELTHNQFWCGDSDDISCDTCPHDYIDNDTCNSFTQTELAYITSNHPELLL